MNDTTRNAARIIATLFLLQMLIAPVVNFRLLAPAMSAPSGFLANAATRAGQVNVALLLAMVAAALGVGIAITAWPIVARHSRGAATWFVVLTTVTLASTIMEGLSLRAMLALSQAYVGADRANAATIEALAGPLRAVRIGAHFTSFLLGGCALLAFYGALLRYRLVPRPLAVLCLVAVLSLLVAALLPLMGRHTVMALFMPMGVGQLAVTAWLAIKGFEMQAVPAEVTT